MLITAATVMCSHPFTALFFQRLARTLYTVAGSFYSITLFAARKGKQETGAQQQLYNKYSSRKGVMMIGHNTMELKK